MNALDGTAAPPTSSVAAAAATAAASTSSDAEEEGEPPVVPGGQLFEESVPTDSSWSRRIQRRQPWLEWLGAEQTGAEQTGAEQNRCLSVEMVERRAAPFAVDTTVTVGSAGTRSLQVLIEVYRTANRTANGVEEEEKGKAANSVLLFKAVRSPRFAVKSFARQVQDSLVDLYVR